MTQKNPTLRQSAISGNVATIGGQGLRFFVQIAWTYAMARLLSPQDFGVYAMATPLITFVILFQDLGFTQAIATQRLTDHATLSTVFRINLLVTVGLAGLLLAGTPLFVLFYRDAALQSVIPVIAFTILVTGLSTVHRSILMRDLRYGTLTLIESIALVIGTVLSVLWAAIWPGPVSLVVAGAASAAIVVVLAVTTTRWWPSFGGPGKDIAAILKFGGGLTSFNLTNFFARNADNIIIGRSLGAGPLGLYDRAYKLMALPMQQITAPTARVMTPVLARLLDQPDRYRAAYRRTLQAVMLISLPGCAVLIVTAREVIGFVLGPAWLPAAEIFAWLGVAALVQPFSSTQGWLLVSQQRTTEMAVIGLLRGILFVTAFLVGLRWGVVGVAAAYAITDVAIQNPITWWMTTRKGPVSRSDMLKVVLPAGFHIAMTIALLSGIKSAIAFTGFSVVFVLMPVSYVVFTLLTCTMKDGRSTVIDMAATVRGYLVAGRRE